MDAHVVGNKIMADAWRRRFKVVNIGTLPPRKIHPRRHRIGGRGDPGGIALRPRGNGVPRLPGELHRGRDRQYPLVVGGNLVIGRQQWEEVEKSFLEMGFNRVYPPGVSPKKVIEDLKKDLINRGEQGKGGREEGAGSQG